MQKTQWRSRSSCWQNLVTCNSRPQGPTRQLRISKQSPICSHGAGSGHSMDPGVSVLNHNFTRNPEKLAKVPGTREETKSHLHWQFLAIRQSLWRSLLESLHVYTTRIGNKMGLLKEQCAEWRKAPLLYCCNRVWIKVGGQILWNVTPIFQTSQIWYLMERRLMKDVLGNHLKDLLFPLVHWLSITLSLRKISQESNLERKSYLDCSSDTLCTRGGISKGDVLIADPEELETMDASEIYSKRLNAKDVVFLQKGEFTFPIEDGRIKLPGGDQQLRTSTLVRHRPIQGESNIDFPVESEGSPPPPLGKQAFNNNNSIKRQWDCLKPKCWRDDKTLRPVICCQASEKPKPNEKEPDRTGKPVWWFWDPGMAARIQGKFGGWWTGRLSRQFFSWSIFKAHVHEKWGFG